ncbi:MAG TPA: 1-acyl-sn-glycerol-3-phosphate acyltransferase, partial [bacterium]|nr:1-acyl-sn-glycerol-3-phosphate acyltransferase [bacterium]
IFFRKYKFELTYGGIDFFHSDPSDQAWASHMDYRKGRRAQQKKTLFVKAVFDMAYVAHICLSGLKYLGPSYLRAFADQLIAVLGKRLLQLSESSLSVLGAEKLQGLQGKFILIFNHKSAFDFALTPYVLSHITVNNRRVRPRFILAQDHFKDNWFLYHVIGMGKAAEAIDMIFVSRKDQKKSFDNLKQAAQTMIEKDVDIAIYPQGTRAAGNYDRADKRRDAGYYTTVRKKDLNSKWPHLKRGTAFLALDVLTQLRVSGDDQELHLVFIGISGTATVLPKGSLAVQTEAEVVFTIGDVLSLSPHMLDDLFVADQPREEAPLARKKFATELTGVINEKLLSVLNLKFQLLQRFLTELKGQFHYDNERLQVVQNNMVMIDKSSDVVFEILDKIYSLPVSQWNGYLSQLSQMLLGKPDLTRFEILAHDVTEDLLSLKAK